MRTDQMISGVEKQMQWLNSLSIEKPGLLSPIGMAFNYIGKGIHLVVVDGACWTLDTASKKLNEMVKDVPILRDAIKVATTVLIDIPSGALEGAGELLEGVATMISHPIESLKGMGALIGRDPSTGEWSLKTAGNSLKEIAKALIAVEDFKKGNYGKAVGKILLNVLTTVTGAGAAAAGSSMVVKMETTGSPAGAPEVALASIFQ